MEETIKHSREPKEPFMRVTRNLTISKKATWFIRIGGIVAGFLLCAIIAGLLKQGTFLDYFRYLGEGVFGSPKRVVNFFEEIALLLIISIALTPCFRMKFWNIGAEGQVLAASTACFAIMRFLGGTMNDGLLWILMIVCSIGVGIVWAVIPALFKAFFNTNETLFTLMMNYIAKGLVLYFISVWYPSGSGVADVATYGNIPAITIGGVAYDYIINIIVVAVITAIVFVYLRFTKHGYEIDVVGGSVNTAKYVGMNVKLIIIRTMILTGAICGLAGFLITAGATHTINTEVVGGRGFTAVLICWLSNLNPLEMVLNSALVAFITKGSGEACSHFFTNGSNYTDIMIGIFFFVIIASTFFTRYKVVFPRHKEKAFALEPNVVPENETIVEEKKDKNDENVFNKALMAIEKVPAKIKEKIADIKEKRNSKKKEDK